MKSMPKSKNYQLTLLSDETTGRASISREQQPRYNARGGNSASALNIPTVRYYQSIQHEVLVCFILPGVYNPFEPTTED
jgi:hypothetical protein